MLVQPGRRLLIGKFAGGHDDIGHAGFPLPDIFQKKKIAHRLSGSRGSGGIVSDHGGFRNDCLRDRLHGCIADHRSSLVQAHEIKGA